MAAHYKEHNSVRRLQSGVIIAAIITITAIWAPVEVAYGHGQDTHPAASERINATDIAAEDAESHDKHEHGSVAQHGNDETKPVSSHAPETGTEHAHMNGEHGHEPSTHHHEGNTESAPTDAEAAGGHDHSAHESWATNSFERFLAWLGKFHPALTNFPIGLLIAAALAEVLLISRGNNDERLMHAARYCAALGALTALLAAGFGWFYAGFDVVGDDAVLSAHRWNGTAIGILSLGLGVLVVAEQERRSSSWRNAFRAVLFILTIMVSVNGYLGGRMLYGADHYAWPTHQHDDAHEHTDH